MPVPVDPTYFASAASFRAWLHENHRREEILWVGFHKRHTRRPSLTWEESVDAALCYGWIDGLRKSVDASCYVIRFSRRKPESIWSVRNVGRVRELVRLKLMQPAGLEAYRKLNPQRSALYSFEQRKAARFQPAQVRRFKADPKAWGFFRDQAPSYQRLCTFWVTSAKKEPTRLRRLDRLIEVSALGVRLDAFGPAFPKKT